MPNVTRLRRFLPDPYLAAILSMVALAAVLPAQGSVAVEVTRVTSFAISLLFFLYGLRLSPRAVWQGLAHWRLQGLIFGVTFGLFPLAGLLLYRLAPPLLGAPLATGMLFLCLLPSTAQSAIVFTSIARGNLPAALCAASLSNLLGMFITPLLVALTLGVHGGGGLGGLEKIIRELLAPFLLGQLLRAPLAGIVGRYRHIMGLADRASVLLVVYSAFSQSVVAGLWHHLRPQALAALLGINILLLGLALLSTSSLSRLLGFSREDRIAVVFCGSKKSLASGLPMANILFPAATVGVIVVPIMLFHQIQLMACAWLARRYARDEVG